MELDTVIVAKPLEMITLANSRRPLVGNSPRSAGEFRSSDQTVAARDFWEGKNMERRGGTASVAPLPSTSVASSGGLSRPVGNRLSQGRGSETDA
jgi:hypothetical protein